MAAAATADVAGDAAAGGGVELAVNPGVEDPLGPKVLDWMHVPETRFARR